CTDEGDDW
nr:immunoglobulin heavy chain junction region [Macaca mulatta]